jgi:hypothetical protein
MLWLFLLFSEHCDSDSGTGIVPTLPGHCDYASGTGVSVGTFSLPTEVIPSSVCMDHVTFVSGTKVVLTFTWAL